MMWMTKHEGGSGARGGGAAEVTKAYIIDPAEARHDKYSAANRISRI